MKFIKIMACILALISVMMVFTSCTITNHGAETTPAATVAPQEQIKYKATVHLLVTVQDGDNVKEIYTTMSENEDDNVPHEYTSLVDEAYIFNVIADYADFNDKYFAYETSSRKKTVQNEDGEKETITLYTLEKISITAKKKTKTYAADTTVILEKDGVKYETKTYWVFFVNGVEVKESNEMILKDGDVLECRLAYNAEDYNTPVVETPDEPEGDVQPDEEQ